MEQATSWSPDVVGNTQMRREDCGHRDSGTLRVPELALYKTEPGTRGGVGQAYKTSGSVSS